MRPYKALFVTHDVSYYGAARSLQTLLRHYATERADLLVNKRLMRGNDIEDIRERFGPHVSSVREFHLPFDRCYKGKASRSVVLRVREALWKVNHSRLVKYIEKQQFDFIYLNSLVLHPMISEHLPFVIHVREIYDGTNPQVLESLRKARGSIFIDEATRYPFRDLGLNHVVLNNPCDVRPIDRTMTENLKKSLQIGDKTVFSLVGAIVENKGTDFIIDCFKRARNDRAILLIVGAGKGQYLNRCLTIAAGADNIVFHGFEKDVAAIYCISDYVLRGEAYPCVGRTIYEGLYAGCDVIIPGDSDAGEHMFQYEKFKDMIHFYAPRDSVRLVDFFGKLPKKRERRATWLSNVDEFIRDFDKFIEGVLEDQDGRAGGSRVVGREHELCIL